MAAVAENAVKNDEPFSNCPFSDADADKKSEFQRDVQKLVDLLSKLNPSAKEFFPSYYSAAAGDRRSQNELGEVPAGAAAAANKDSGSDTSSGNRRKRNNFNQWKRRLNGRAIRAQREDSIRRTVYVAEIDQHVTEERLAALFIHCGQVRQANLNAVCQYCGNFEVVDCRICGDTHSVLRFAFVEFADEQGARAALNLSGTMLGYYPVRVLPSKTAILPVNPIFLPRSEDEREMCARTVYCTNIDKKVTQTDVKLFFESICGEVSRLRLLGDHVHSTRIAFVEFVMAESAILALKCSGMHLGALPIRVSPSKTPVRPRVPHAM